MNIIGILSRGYYFSMGHLWPHWPLFWAWHKYQASFHPMGLCTWFPHCLECSSLVVCLVFSFTFSGLCHISMRSSLTVLFKMTTLIIPHSPSFSSAVFFPHITYRQLHGMCFLIYLITFCFLHVDS